ncbi:MAG: hypothetical protein ACOZAO_04825 [Patescibacteria group bacterium]
MANKQTTIVGKVNRPIVDLRVSKKTAVPAQRIANSKLRKGTVEDDYGQDCCARSRQGYPCTCNK